MNAAIRIIGFTFLFAAFPLRTAAEDFTDALHAYLQHTVDTAGPNGCFVAGLVDEHGSKVVSYGKSDNGTGRQANGDTLFAIHSASAHFTHLLLLEMVQRGEMKLDDPAAKYLPESVKVPAYEGKQITLRDLAMESSGLPDFTYQLDPKRADDALGDFTVEKMDVFVSGCQFTVVPGTRRLHGGVDYGLLAQAMALKAGMDYESLMADRIFGPLKMDSTRFSLTPEFKSRRASEHDDSGFGYAIPPYNRGAEESLGGLHSTANDLLKSVSATLGLMPSSLAPLMENPVESLYYPQPHAPGMLHSGGGGLGGQAVICFDKARRRGVVILNTSYAHGQDLSAFLLQCEWQSDHRPTVTNIDGRVYDSYVGQYQPESDAALHWSKRWPFFKREADAHSRSGIAIRREGDRIFAQPTGSVPEDDVLLWPPNAVELLPESETCFFERLSGRPVAFDRDHLGRVTGLTLKKSYFDMLPESETNFFDRYMYSQYTFVKNNKGEVDAVIRHHLGDPDCVGRKLKEWAK